MYHYQSNKYNSKNIVQGNRSSSHPSCLEDYNDRANRQDIRSQNRSNDNMSYKPYRSNDRYNSDYYRVNQSMYHPNSERYNGSYRQERSSSLYHPHNNSERYDSSYRQETSSSLNHPHNNSERYDSSYRQERSSSLYRPHNNSERYNGSYRQVEPFRKYDLNALPYKPNILSYQANDEYDGRSYCHKTSERFSGFDKKYKNQLECKNDYKKTSGVYIKSDESRINDKYNNKDKFNSRNQNKEIESRSDSKKTLGIDIKLNEHSKSGESRYVNGKCNIIEDTINASNKNTERSHEVSKSIDSNSSSRYNNNKIDSKNWKPLPIGSKLKSLPNETINNSSRCQNISNDIILSENIKIDGRTHNGINSSKYNSKNSSLDNREGVQIGSKLKNPHTTIENNSILKNNQSEKNQEQQNKHFLESEHKDEDDNDIIDLTEEQLNKTENNHNNDVEIDNLANENIAHVEHSVNSDVLQGFWPDPRVNSSYNDSRVLSNSFINFETNNENSEDDWTVVSTNKNHKFNFARKDGNKKIEGSLIVDNIILKSDFCIDGTNKFSVLVNDHDESMKDVKNADFEKEDTEHGNSQEIVERNKNDVETREEYNENDDRNQINTKFSISSNFDENKIEDYSNVFEDSKKEIEIIIIDDNEKEESINELKPEEDLDMDLIKFINVKVESLKLALENVSFESTVSVLW